MSGNTYLESVKEAIPQASFEPLSISEAFIVATLVIASITTT